jgi:GT2 family glycosyltransferase
VKNHPSWSDSAGGQPRPDLGSVSAVVLTHRRPRLATEVVRSLVEAEGLPPESVVVVVNGTGGLDDAALEASIRLVRLPRNLGPASGFGAGMEVAFADPSVRWAYLCEDDVGLLSSLVHR